MLDDFFPGRPSVYDLASFIVMALILCVVIGIHLKQIKHARLIEKVSKFTGIAITPDKDDSSV